MLMLLLSFVMLVSGLIFEDKDGPKREGGVDVGLHSKRDRNWWQRPFMVTSTMMPPEGEGGYSFETTTKEVEFETKRETQTTGFRRTTKTTAEPTVTVENTNEETGYNDRNLKVGIVLPHQIFQQRRYQVSTSYFTQYANICTS